MEDTTMTQAVPEATKKDKGDRSNQIAVALSPELKRALDGHCKGAGIRQKDAVAQAIQLLVEGKLATAMATIANLEQEALLHQTLEEHLRVSQARAERNEAALADREQLRNDLQNSIAREIDLRKQLDEAKQKIAELDQRLNMECFSLPEG